MPSQGSMEQRVDKREINELKKRLTIVQQQGNNPDEESLILDAIGSLHEKWGNYKQALKYYYFDSQCNRDNSLSSGVAFGKIGNVYYKAKKYDKSVHYHNRHFEIAKRNNCYIEMQRACCNLGNVFLNREWNHNQLVRNGYLEKSLECFKEALAYSFAIQDVENEDLNIIDKIICDSHLNVGISLSELKHYQDALSHYEQSYQIAEMLCDFDRKKRYFLNSGELYENTNELEKALEMYKNYKDESVKRVATKDEIESTLLIGRVLLLNKNYRELKKVLEKLKLQATTDSFVSYHFSDSINDFDETSMESIRGLEKIIKLENGLSDSTSTRTRIKLLSEIVDICMCDLQDWNRSLVQCKKLELLLSGSGLEAEREESLFTLYYNIGFCYYKTGKHESAVRYLRKVVFEYASKQSPISSGTQNLHLEIWVKSRIYLANILRERLKPSGDPNRLDDEILSIQRLYEESGVMLDKEKQNCKIPSL